MIKNFQTSLRSTLRAGLIWVFNLCMFVVGCLAHSKNLVNACGLSNKSLKYFEPQFPYL